MSTRFFNPVRVSLKGLLGEDYAAAVSRAGALAPRHNGSIDTCLRKSVEFLPHVLQERLVFLLARVGRRVSRPLRQTTRGAGSASFAAATRASMSPLIGMGLYRIGEDGRLYLITKSEHYHAPLGHWFPGYRLLDYARAAGIANATHNNTRGHITRVLEEQLVRIANGIAADDSVALARALRSSRSAVLNRVLNLQTGSIAAEAAVKLVLARFYRPQSDSPAPRYQGRTPVLLVIGDRDGQPTANYHGTTFIAQMMRGMWAGLYGALARSGALVIRAVPQNDRTALERIFRECQRPPYQIAGFFLELVLMNHGAIRLNKAFVKRAFDLCRRHDVPTVVDEIQTGLWSPRLLMCREYGIRPSVVVIGKGFPGGEYAASRIIFSAALDSLAQFGALVTNGQQELASLAYLVTMRWAEANAGVTAAIGEHYEQRVRDLADRYRCCIQTVEGSRHLLGIGFHELGIARAFASQLVERGLDVGVQTYKADCPPAALTKLPLIAGHQVVDFVVDRMDETLRQLTRQGTGGLAKV